MVRREARGAQAGLLERGGNEGDQQRAANLLLRNPYAQLPDVLRAGLLPRALMARCLRRWKQAPEATIIQRRALNIKLCCQRDQFRQHG